MDQTAFEERVAHLIAAVDDLSGVVARQDRVIDRLQRQVALLLAREAEREAPGSGEADAPPPHW